MGRAILSVIVGYIVFAAASFAMFTGAYIGLGAERAFNPGVYDVSMLWLVLAVVINLIGAIVGGFACSVIARSGKPPFVFAVLVLGIGLLLGFAAMKTPKESGSRSGEVANLEAMTKAVMPNWFHLSAPIVGAIGVMIGTKRKRKD